MPTLCQKSAAIDSCSVVSITFDRAYHLLRGAQRVLFPPRANVLREAYWAVAQAIDYGHVLPGLQPTARNSSGSIVPRLIQISMLASVQSPFSPGGAGGDRGALMVT